MKKKIQNWMGQKNVTFSSITGETFTNGEVVYTQIGLLSFLMMLGVVGYFFG